MGRAEIVSDNESPAGGRAGIAVGGEIERLSVDEESFFQLGEHDQPANRRFRGRHEQTVISASVKPNNCGGREAAKPIGFQPFPTESYFQIATTSCLN